MAAKGHGTSRIVLVQRPREARPPELTVTPAPAEHVPPPAAGARSGWTLNRLMVGASLGGIATVIGGILFHHNFTLLTGSRGPLLAIAFGLFIVGLIVFFGCLIGLAAAAIQTLAGRRGWRFTSLVLFVPAALVYGLWGAGLYGVMWPALFTTLTAAGIVIALSRPAPTGH
jgi:hypothetical protein